MKTTRNHRWIWSLVFFALAGFFYWLHHRTADSSGISTHPPDPAQPAPPAAIAGDGATAAAVGSPSIPPAGLDVPPPGSEVPLGSRPEPVVPDQPPSGPAAVPSAAVSSPPGAAVMDQPSEYDLRLTALLKQVEDLQSQGDAAGDRVRVLLESANPLDQVAGLTWAAESGRIDPEFDLARFDPEVILAATDLAASLAGAAAADRLLMNWIEQAGGLKSAGEAAHRLLMEARLPYGGGSTALDLMRSVNDPQAILIGLREFAVDPELNPAIRMEALILLRERMDFGAYQEFVRRCAGNARQEGGAWAWRAARLLEQVDGPPDIMAQPREINRTVIDRALARADPGAMEDLEIFLRRETQADHVRMDAETAAYFRAALAAVAESGLTGPDRAALTSLRRQVDSWE